MADDAVLIALDKRIAAVRENIRVVIARTAHYSGAPGAPLMTDQIAEQYALLGALLKEREAAVKNLP